MEKSKIVPNIWFSADAGSISNILAYYQTIFKTNFVSFPIIPLGDTPGGKTEMCTIMLFGQQYVFMNTANVHHPLNDSFSIMINCENQEEIDQYWDYFTTEGKASQCGWCIDKYGLRWQVLPTNLGELMSKPNSFQVMMKQQKIVIAEYL